VFVLPTGTLSGEDAELTIWETRWALLIGVAKAQNHRNAWSAE
jgi:hypothetical protein